MFDNHAFLNTVDAWKLGFKNVLKAARASVTCFNLMLHRNVLSLDYKRFAKAKTTERAPNLSLLFSILNLGVKCMSRGGIKQTFIISYKNTRVGADSACQRFPKLNLDQFVYL